MNLAYGGPPTFTRNAFRKRLYPTNENETCLVGLGEPMRRPEIRGERISRRGLGLAREHADDARRAHVLLYHRVVMRMAVPENRPFLLALIIVK
jgi:hypothetical protein